MAEPYTPTPEEARARYVHGGPYGDMVAFQARARSEFDRMLDAVRAEVIGTFGARAFDGLSITQLCHHARTVYGLLGEDEEPFDLTAEGSESSGKNGGERAGRVGREPLAFAPVTPSAEED